MDYYQRYSSIWLGLILLFCLQACSTQRPQYPDNEPRKIEILFLGHDSEHHNSAQYLPILASALAQQNINFTYTDSPEALNQENLYRYDALMVYANHDSITPQQEEALLNYVGDGHGFLPIHCATWSFRNSQEVVDLMGGQFLSHGTDTFQASILAEAQDHPVLQDFEPFRSWDETYVHSQHNPDRSVLMERIEGDHVEPWTWVRDYEKGRVFYTASGHDESTWRQPQFHKLLENAIVWSVGDRVKNLWTQLPKPAPLIYTDAIIPNYEKRDPLPQLQTPLSAKASQQLMQIPPGFELTLFAEEPDIINPISMAWDEKGRLWVIETVDYPNTIRTENGIGDDRIKILEDTDGDGRADKFTIFADQLNIPTSLVFANGGVIVAQAPHFVFLRDTDGDDVADERQNLISGWGKFDTHAGPSNLTYGHDNMIWGAVGYSGFEGQIDGQDFKFGQGFYRFQSNGKNFEFLTRSSNNTWGLGLTEDFQVFGSTANNTHSVHLGIPDRYYQDVKGLPGYGSRKIDGHYAFHPITQNVRQVDVFNGFTAAAGHNIYTARQFPERYWNQVAFVCAPTGRLIHEAILKPEGAAYSESDGWNIMASNDEWFGPVDAEVGPDGALWIADWYNFIIQHNPTPPGFSNGDGNAHINPLRDRQHGRIYRLHYKYGPDYQPIQLSKDDPQALLKALSHDNLFWRLTAQRLLVERGGLDVVDDLVALAANAKTDAIGLKPAKLHALWTLHGLGALDSSHPKALEMAHQSLVDPVAAIRRTAIQTLPKGDPKIKAAKLWLDPNPQTRLSAILAMSEMLSSAEMGVEIYQISKEPTIVNDQWLSQAVYCAATRHQAGFWQAWQNDPQAENLSAQASKIDWVNRKDYEAWPTVALPSWFTAFDYGSWDGDIWYKKELNIPANLAGRKATFSMGPTDDIDSVFVNGQLIGQTKHEYRTNRRYNVPAGLLKNGKNVVTIKIFDSRGRGGMTGKAADIKLQIGNKTFPMGGNWHYAIGKENLNANSTLFGPDNSIVQMLATNYRGNNTVTDGTEAKADIVLNLGVIQNQMKYDQESLTVKAGALVEIRFKNDDFMQHNLLIISQGSLDKVGAAADALATASDGAAQQYVPNMPEVLYSTKLVDPNTEVVLRFRAPEEPGEYPFVCTFPGHWRIMNGILKVEKAKAI